MSESVSESMSEADKRKQTSEVDPSYYKNTTGGDLRSSLRSILTEQQYVGQAMFNIFKYVDRFQDKNGLTDLYKAKNYLEDLIDYYESITEETEGTPVAEEYTEKKLPINSTGQEKANDHVDRQKFVQDKKDKQRSKSHQDYLSNK